MKYYFLLSAFAFCRNSAAVYLGSKERDAMLIDNNGDPLPEPFLSDRQEAIQTCESSEVDVCGDCDSVRYHSGQCFHEAKDLCAKAFEAVSRNYDNSMARAAAILEACQMEYCSDVYLSAWKDCAAENTECSSCWTWIPETVCGKAQGAYCSNGSSCCNECSSLFEEYRACVSSQGGCQPNCQDFEPPEGEEHSSSSGVNWVRTGALVVVLMVAGLLGV